MTTPRSDLRKLHMLLTFILAEFDRVCSQIGVTYALYGGSTIGAVRHGGFIPWDDDIDVFMIRQDYERFLREAPDLLAQGFRIDNQRTVPRYHLLFSKLGLDGTVFLSQGEVNPDYTPPIFLDIFPLDAVPRDQRRFRTMRRRTWWWGRLLFLSGIPTPKLPDMAPWKRSLVHAVTRTANVALRACRLSPVALYERWEKAARSAEDEATDTYTDFTMRDPQNWIVRRDELLPTRRVPFEAIEAPVPRDVEALLTRGYGDYMRIPDPADRLTHLPEKILFGSYDPDRGGVPDLLAPRDPADSSPGDANTTTHTATVSDDQP